MISPILIAMYRDEAKDLSIQIKLFKAGLTELEGQDCKAKIILQESLTKAETRLATIKKYI